VAEVRSLGQAAIAADPPGRPAAVHSEAGPGPIAIAVFGLYIVVLIVVMIEQGVEMKRPSRIFVRASRRNDRVVNVRVGGNVVEVLRGELFF